MTVQPHPFDTRIIDPSKGTRSVRVTDEVCFGDAYPPVLIAGPCAVEDYETVLTVAQAVKAAGATMLRGGAFKPRTNPWSFQGLGVEGLRILHEVGKQVGLPVVTEIMDPRQVSVAEGYVEMFQIGTRNMQNFDLLHEVGSSSVPVMLKRGMSATFEEWALSAEHVAKNGNESIVLCERGIRTFESYTRNTLDLSAVPVMKALTGLPVIVDPSHATGRPELIPPLSKAAIAIGCDGIMIEVHPEPTRALCDGKQAMLPSQYAALARQLVEGSTNQTEKEGRARR